MARSIFHEEFTDNLKKLEAISQNVVQDLLKYPPDNWCRAYFSSRCQSYMVDNNIVENFNSLIKDTRFKPIVSMLDDIKL